MKLSLHLSADEDAATPDWEKVKTILQSWSQEYNIVLPPQLASAFSETVIFIETASPQQDMLTTIGSLAEQFYDLGINMELETV